MCETTKWTNAFSPAPLPYLTRPTGNRGEKRDKAQIACRASSWVAVGSKRAEATPSPRVAVQGPPEVENCKDLLVCREDLRRIHLRARRPARSTRRATCMS